MLKTFYNRPEPDVAGAVLQTPLLLIDSDNESVILFLNIFKLPSLQIFKS